MPATALARFVSEFLKSIFFALTVSFTTPSSASIPIFERNLFAYLPVVPVVPAKNRDMHLLNDGLARAGNALIDCSGGGALLEL